jgi:hypothetical protein
MQTRQYSFQQEQEHPDGLPKTDDDECAEYQRSHQGRVSQQRFSPWQSLQQHAQDIHNIIYDII